MSGKSGGILEWMAERCGLPYVSDLRLNMSKSGESEDILQLITHTPADAWTLEAWCGAIQYLTDEAQNFDSAEQARVFLLKWLQ